MIGFVDGLFLMRRFLLLVLLMVCIVKQMTSGGFFTRFMISYTVLQSTAPISPWKPSIFKTLVGNGLVVPSSLVASNSLMWTDANPINPPQPTYIGATQKTLLLSSESKGKEAPLIVTDADLWTDDGTTVYTDGDLSDQAEGGFTPEEIEPDFFVVIPAMAMHGMTRGQAPKFITSGGNEEEVEDLRLCLRFVVFYCSWQKGDRRTTTFIEPCSIQRKKNLYDWV